MSPANKIAGLFIFSVTLFLVKRITFTSNQKQLINSLQ